MGFIPHYWTQNILCWTWQKVKTPSPFIFQVGKSNKAQRPGWRITVKWGKGVGLSEGCQFKTPAQLSIIPGSCANFLILCFCWGERERRMLIWHILSDDWYQDTAMNKSGTIGTISTTTSLYTSTFHLIYRMCLFKCLGTKWLLWLVH